MVASVPAPEIKTVLEPSLRDSFGPTIRTTNAKLKTSSHQKEMDKWNEVEIVGEDIESPSSDTAEYGPYQEDMTAAEMNEKVRPMREITSIDQLREPMEKSEANLAVVTCNFT